jgi:hypothetical protein
MAAKREPLPMTSAQGGSDQLSLTHEFLSMTLAVRRAGVTVTTGTLQQAGSSEIAGELDSRYGRARRGLRRL